MDKDFFDNLHNQAKAHHIEHKCGGAPYKFYFELFNFLTSDKNVTKNKIENKLNILEIGTAVGFMSSFFALLFNNSILDTIEIEKEHYKISKENFKKNNLTNINLIHSDANSFMQCVRKNYYDIIFFDGYKPEIENLNHYKRILKVGGILISSNSHLSPSKTNEYFTQLENKKEWQLLGSFGDTKIYLKL